MKTALFVDFDNVYSGLRRISTQGADRLARQPAKWLQLLTDNLPTTGADSETAVNRRVQVRRRYSNPAMFNQFRRPCHEAGFEIVDCPPTTASGRTSTDIHLLLDTIDALQDSTHVNEFAVFCRRRLFTIVATFATTRSPHHHLCSWCQVGVLQGRGRCRNRHPHVHSGNPPTGRG